MMVRIGRCLLFLLQIRRQAQGEQEEQEEHAQEAQEEGG